MALSVSNNTQFVTLPCSPLPDGVRKSVLLSISDISLVSPLQLPFPATVSPSLGGWPFDAGVHVRSGIRTAWSQNNAHSTSVRLSSSPWLICRAMVDMSSDGLDEGDCARVDNDGGTGRESVVFDEDPEPLVVGAFCRLLMSASNLLSKTLRGRQWSVIWKISMMCTWEQELEGMEGPMIEHGWYRCLCMWEVWWR